MQDKGRNILILVFAAIILLGLWQFWVTFKDLKSIRSRYVISLPVSHERAEAKQAAYTKDKKELKRLQEKIEELALKLGGLEKQNARLLQDKQSFGQQVLVLEKEKEVLEDRLGSLAGLKKAIRQVKIKLHEERIKDYFVRIKRQKEIDEIESSLGNKGFLLRGGATTYKSRVRIEVKPVQ